MSSMSNDNEVIFISAAKNHLKGNNYLDLPSELTREAHLTSDSKMLWFNYDKKKYYPVCLMKKKTSDSDSPVLVNMKQVKLHFSITPYTSDNIRVEGIDIFYSNEVPPTGTTGVYWFQAIRPHVAGIYKCCIESTNFPDIIQSKSWDIQVHENPNLPPSSFFNDLLTKSSNSKKSRVSTSSTSKTSSSSVSNENDDERINPTSTPAPAPAKKLKQMSITSFAFKTSDTESVSVSVTARSSIGSIENATTSSQTQEPVVGSSMETVAQTQHDNGNVSVEETKTNATTTTAIITGSKRNRSSTPSTNTNTATDASEPAVNNDDDAKADKSKSAAKKIKSKRDSRDGDHDNITMMDDDKNNDTACVVPSPTDALIHMLDITAKMLSSSSADTASSNNDEDEAEDVLPYPSLDVINLVHKRISRPHISQLVFLQSQHSQQSHDVVNEDENKTTTTNNNTNMNTVHSLPKIVFPASLVTVLLDDQSKVKSYIRLPPSSPPPSTPTSTSRSTSLMKNKTTKHTHNATPAPAPTHNATPAPAHRSRHHTDNDDDDDDDEHDTSSSVLLSREETYELIFQHNKSILDVYNQYNEPSVNDILCRIQNTLKKNLINDTRLSDMFKLIRYSFDTYLESVLLYSIEREEYIYGAKLKEIRELKKTSYACHFGAVYLLRLLLFLSVGLETTVVTSTSTSSTSDNHHLTESESHGNNYTSANNSSSNTRRDQLIVKQLLLSAHKLQATIQFILKDLEQSSHFLF